MRAHTSSPFPVHKQNTHQARTRTQDAQAYILFPLNLCLKLSAELEYNVESLSEIRYFAVVARLDRDFREITAHNERAFK